LRHGFDRGDVGVGLNEEVLRVDQVEVQAYSRKIEQLFHPAKLKVYGKLMV
jgi:hypothetical protein